ncbi:MAG TPA: helix-turn-helix domain-containing protein [Thermoleophilaceae bacterium]|jgi:DNA-binding HxlR family transcriptional regulator|nr:helix-turn-helix domain-containing protein [Thermoleophilaceae bacterium]
MSGPSAQPRTSAVEALDQALAAVGDRWTLLVVAALLDGPRRFGDLQEAIPGIATNVLTQRLRALQEESLVSAEPYSARPARYSYELSAAGAELAGALRLLADWAGRNRSDTEPLQHAVCGTPLEAAWYCPACDVVEKDADAGDELHFA